MTWYVQVINADHSRSSLFYELYQTNNSLLLAHNAEYSSHVLVIAVPAPPLDTKEEIPLEKQEWKTAKEAIYSKHSL